MQNAQTVDVIAIDGPAGAGKSTVARRVAESLHWSYVDTGAMYRALCLKALRQGTSITDNEALAELARNTCIAFRHGDGSDRVLLDGTDVTEAIRRPEISEHVSQVAAQPGVRAELSRLQREVALRGQAVVDGRDIGTYVVPEARLKVFLTADFAERVHRRHRELRQRGFQVSSKEVSRGLAQRDRIDSGREVAPLRPADDAVLVDTTNLSILQVVERIVEEYKKLGEAPE